MNYNYGIHNNNDYLHIRKHVCFMPHTVANSVSDQTSYPESDQLESHPVEGTIAADYWAAASDPARIRRWKWTIYLRKLVWRATIAASETLKRLIDIVGGLFLLLAALPLLLLIAVLVKLDDGGPVLFRQPRVGKHGKIFWLWKVRSMVPDAEALKAKLAEQNQHGAEGVTFKMEDDPRITKVGRWIRKSSIDEMPQFWNVVRGEMSLVGPRPPSMCEVAKYKALHLRRLIVKPGITCLWQIGGRADIDFEGQVRLDLKYIRSEGFWNDIRILCLTVPAVVFGKGSY